MIRDTGFSSKYAGKVVYHCGYDIFNNQMLRNIDFSLTPKISSTISSQSEKKGFNSITDYRRDHNGKTVKFFKPTIVTRGGKRYIASGNTESEHEHMYDTTLQFSKSIDSNLTEKDGWWGIENKCNMSIANYTYNNETINLSKGSFITDINNRYDDYSLVILTTPSGEKIITNTSEFERFLLNELGTYVLTTTDRVNNKLIMNLEVA